MTRSRLSPRPLLVLLAPVAALVLFAGAASAQDYPDRPITFVVPFAPGGLSDVPGRLLAAEMQKRIGQSVIVENKRLGPILAYIAEQQKKLDMSRSAKAPRRRGQKNHMFKVG